MCFDCRTMFTASMAYAMSIDRYALEQNQIFCDLCDPGEEEQFTYEDACQVFWDEVWS